MRSEQIKTGVERTPNRSLLYALGYTDEELEEGINDCLDDLNDAQDKLNENGSPP